MAEFAWKLVTFDIDGTLTLGHGWAHIADALGRRPPYDETQRRFRAGEIGEDEHLRNLLAIADGRTVDEVEAALESTPKIGGIDATIAELHARGIPVALLTHNPGFVCRWYARRYGFDDFAGAEATEPLDGRIPAPGPVVADKWGTLERLLARRGVPAARTIHVGDARPDALIFPRIGGGIAINARIADVREAADATIDTEDLRELLPLLERLRPRL